MNALVKELQDIIEIKKIVSEIADDTLVNEIHASAILEVLGRKYSADTLRKIRCVSTQGPAYRKAPNGHIRYSVGDLRAFAAIKIS